MSDYMNSPAFNSREAAQSFAKLGSKSLGMTAGSYLGSALGGTIGWNEYDSATGYVGGAIAGSLTGAALGYGAGTVGGSRFANSSSFNRVTKDLTRGSLQSIGSTLSKATIAGSAIGALAGGFGSEDGFGNTVAGTLTGSSLGGGIGMLAGAAGLAAVSKYKVGKMTRTRT